MTYGWIQTAPPGPGVTAVDRLGRIPGPGVLAAGDADAELVSRWRAGDDGAFEALVVRHEARVLRVALRVLGDPMEAEDAAQEAFLRLHRHGGRFRGAARFSTFVYRVAVNAALNRRRSLARARRRERTLAAARVGEFDRAPGRDPEAALAGGELQSQVQGALLELPDDQRVAVALVDLEGLAYREAAAVLRIPEGTVKSRVHRARRALRERLRPLVGRTGEAP